MLTVFFNTNTQTVKIIKIGVKTTTSKLDLENKFAILLPTSHQNTIGSNFSTIESRDVFFMYLHFIAAQKTMTKFMAIDTNDMIFIDTLESSWPSQVILTGTMPRKLAV